MRRNNISNEALQRSQQILYYLVLEGIFLGKRENIYTMLCLSSLDTKCNPSHPCVQKVKKKKIGEPVKRKAKRTEKNGTTSMHKL